MALALLCVASFMAVVDTTIVSIALPSIRRAMEFSPSGSQWVLNAYALVFGGLLLLFGRLGDRMGRRRLFIVGLIVFLAGSVLAGVATQAWVLLGGRIIQGLGAAAFVPSSLSLLIANFAAGSARSRALAAYGAMAGLGFVVGMVGGGLITELLGWRWIFLLNIPIAATGTRCLAGKPQCQQRRFDRRRWSHHGDDRTDLADLLNDLRATAWLAGAGNLGCRFARPCRDDLVRCDRAASR
jgi:MFS family permease